MNILAKYHNSLSVQDYSKKPTIEGVELIESPLFRDDGGHFSEIVRLDESGNIEGLSEDFKVRQLSTSLLSPGTIKAYHIHLLQDDVWFVPPSQKVLVNLHDVREDSATADVHMRFVLGDGKNQILRIPKGVAHGASNPYGTSMILVYATSTQFNDQDPDEHRLPWDEFGAEYWQVTRG